MTSPFWRWKMQDTDKAGNIQSVESSRLALLSFPAQPPQLRLVRCVVREACDMCGCAPATTQDLVIAVGEAAQNVVRHAYAGIDNGEASLEILCKNGSIEFRLQDFAPTVDKSMVTPKRPTELRPGGLGLCLIHDVMDEVDYLPVPGGHGNLLRLVKRIERDQ